MNDDQNDDLTIPSPPAPPLLLRVAVDDGLAQMKLVGEMSDGSITYIKIPSAIRSATAGGLVDMSGEAIGLYQTDNGSRYVCSPDLAGEETRHPDFHISDHDLVLVTHTLIECGYSASDQIELLTALPVDEYFTGGTVNRARIDQKSANLRRPLTAFNSAVTMPQIVESVASRFVWKLPLVASPVWGA